MSVLKSKRKTSRLEFLHNAYVIQRSFALLLLRNFGTKPKIRATRFFAAINKMSEEDKNKFLDLTDKYGITSIVDEYPEWLISDMRNRVLQEARFLIRNIIQANSIYPAYVSEYMDRRRYQTMAIGNCEQLLQEMQFVISILDVDVNKYLPYVDMIEKEIALLRAWRKSDNRLLERAKQNEAKRLNTKEDISNRTDEDITNTTTATASRQHSGDDLADVKVEEQGTLVQNNSHVSTGPEEQKAVEENGNTKN